jgi:hypothetical protein
MARILLFAFGAGVAGVLSVVLLRSRTRSGPLDVGTVSEQWIAEHRAGFDDGLYR